MESVLGKFWDMMMATFPYITSNCPTGKKPGLDHKEYYQLQVRLHKALVEGFEQPGYQKQLNHAIQRDWELDLGEEEQLRKGGFYDAVFAVIDTWTRGLSPDEYGTFATLLFGAVSESGRGGLVLQPSLDSVDYADLSARAQDDCWWVWVCVRARARARARVQVQVQV